MPVSLFAAWALVFLTNAITFPFPPAWTILSAFYATGQLPLLPLTVGGSAAATLGRTIFAWTVGRFTCKLSAQQRANAEALATAAHQRLPWPWLFVVLYSFLPVSSDALFVAVGTGALPARSSIISFFFARSIFNTLMVMASRPAVGSVADLFSGRLSWSAALLVAATIGGYMLFLKLPWSRWLGIQTAQAPVT